MIPPEAAAPEISAVVTHPSEDNPLSPKVVSGVRLVLRSERGRHGLYSG